MHEYVPSQTREQEVLCALINAKERALAIFDAPIWKHDGEEHLAHRLSILSHGESEAYVAALMYLAHPEHFSTSLRPSDLFLGFIIHDIGKTEAVDNPRVWHLRRHEIADEDLNGMQRHVQMGYEILLRYQQLTDVALPQVVFDILLYHHEKLDGSGKPFGLKGNQLPYVARLAVIIDQVVARCEPRKYHDRVFTIMDAFADVELEAGTRYDAVILDELNELFRNNEHLTYPKLQWMGQWE